MRRNRSATTAARIARWVREGRGQGSTPDYKPWLRVHDVPSDGVSHRAPCETDGGKHRLLSYHEHAALLMAGADTSVVDVREAYPLQRRKKPREK